MKTLVESGHLGGMYWVESQNIQDIQVCYTEILTSSSILSD